MEQQNDWPVRLVNLFANVNPHAMEKEFYPAYNVLLNQVFTFNEGFVVAPVTEPVESRMSIDFTVGYEYVIEENNQPVLFLEIKPAYTITSKANRKSADHQMRERFIQLFERCPIDTLYGISAFGTRICIYHVTRENGIIQPIAIEDHVNIMIDSAPLDRWNIDILNVQGRMQLNGIFNLVKQMCANLPQQ